VAFVVLAVVALEIASRIMAPHLDYDRTHIHDFPEIVGELEKAAHPQILIYGNSLVMHGIDEELLRKELAAATSGPCSIAKIAPVGTAVRDWVYLYDTYFTAQDTHPDAVVIGFVAHHLPDDGELKIRRLARHFCSSENLWSCLRDETTNFEDRALGALSHVSAVFGDQQELQWGSIHWCVPEFSEGVRKINHFLDDKAARDAKAAAAASPAAEPKPKTYEQLAALLEVFHRHEVRAYFVPMPQPETWLLDPALIETIEAGGATLLDARQIAGITPEDFSDGYHLGPTGTKKLTRFLAKALAGEPGG
jgi:hypothetical protein